ncbi:helix-turn-helix domain-containing protein [Streptomyces sp. JH14]|uniref:helix-turn-helix domain-containing protein n=1 Tax=Streptomyces sp. JH14 TaxID=2793630 RepID=UPI0023F941B0|nr:helix-turn-helix transcriptional regulator [Streptomyces sp. JH14]MDF6044071.1 helix-turn-helix domain-containing protein [Streptomyces sp. JH14]
MFGTLLRFYREQAGLSQEVLGLKIGFSKSQVAMVERGQRPPRGNFIARADEALGAQGALNAAGAELTFSHLASWFEPFATEEAKASARHEYETHVVPGLLQTEEYARAVFTNHHPSLDDEEIEGRVAARLKRQELLARRPVADIGFVLELHPLTRPIGGHQTRKRQLRHILDVAQLRNVQIQVMAPERISHAGLNGPFVLLETAERSRLAYIEGQSGSFFITEQPDLGNLFGKYGILRAQALSPEASMKLIEEVAGEE